MQAERPADVPPGRVVDIDIYRLPGAEHDPHAAWLRLQQAQDAQVLWTPRNGGHWLLLRGADIAAAYADHARFSSRITIVPRHWGEQYPLRPTTLDPPEHSPYRRFLTAALAPERVRAAAAVARRLAGAAAERVRQQGRCDAIADFATQIPLPLFLALAGLPADDAALLPRYAEDPAEGDAVPVMQRYADYLRARLAERRQRPPGSDLLAPLLAPGPDGRTLDADEAVDAAVALMTGGIDTVVAQLGYMLVHLARHPAQRRRLVDDPALLRPAVAEMLRRFPLMTKARLLREDLLLDGVPLRAGDMVVLPPLNSLDATLFDDPVAVDFARLPARHAAFGNGVHRCPGAALASLELEAALGAWLAAIPDFGLDPQQPPRMRSGILNAVLGAGLCWDPARTHGPAADHGDG